MLFTDTYYTITKPATGEFKSKGSKFMAFAFPIVNEEACKVHLQEIKKLHPLAAHHCYALVLGAGALFQKFSDDREPANTAGRPILRAILALELTGVIVIVVRYFGGKLLGVPGLIEAYHNAAEDALNRAERAERFITERYQLTAGFEHENEVFTFIKQHKATVLSQDYTDTMQLTVELRKSAATHFKNAVSANHHIQVKFLSEQ
jgi:uncharacterized YigZ family protein